MNEPRDLTPEELRFARELGIDPGADAQSKDLADAAEALLEELLEVAEPREPAATPTGANAAKLAVAWVCTRCGAQACLEEPGGEYTCGKDLGGCGRTIELRNAKWRWLNGIVGRPTDVVISSRIAIRSALRLKSMARPDEEFTRVAEESTLPKFLWPHLREQIEEMYRATNGGWIQLDTNRRITLNEQSIDITVISQRADDKVYPVISKPFDILRRVRIKDKIVATIRDTGGEFSGTLPEIRTRLDHNQQILNHRDVADVLGHLLSQVPIISRGQFAYGVYMDGDKLALPEFIIPKNDFQNDAYNAIQPHLATTATDDDWQAYADFFSLYNAYEWMPVAGLAAIAPFSPVLRATRIISPGIMLLGEKGIGKSSLAEACSKKLWAQEMLSANDMGTEFRLPAFLDSIAALLVVDDAENFKWNEFGGYLKKSLESIRGASRGTSARTKDDFLNLASLAFTANFMPHLSASLLARFLIIEADDARLTLPEAVRAKFKATEKRLRPLGPLLARKGLELFKDSLAEFQRILELEIQPQIERANRGWADNRRPVVWSVIYLGLRLLHEASGKRIPLMPYDQFVREVVTPVEHMTRQATMDPLVQLREFIQFWVATKKERSFEHNGRESVSVSVALGEGTIILPDVWEDPRMPGHWIAAPFLGQYNKENAKRVEAQIPDLVRAARLVSKRYPMIKLDQLLDKDGDVKSKKMSGQTRRAVFIPDIDPDQVTQRPLGGEVVGGNGGGDQGHNGTNGQKRLSSAMDRTMIVLDAIRATPAHETGVAAEKVYAAAVQQGLDPAAAHAAVDELLAEGRLWQPTNGRLAIY